MNFAFSEEQEELRRTVRQFLEAKSPETEVRRLMETTEGYDPAVWKQMGQELGLQGLAIPEEYGGQGYTFIELGIILEEMGRVLLCAPYFSSVVLAANAILNAGTDAQKSALLPGIASGDTIATLAFTEPSGKWDAAGITMEATENGGKYTLSGEKMFVLDGHIADLIVVVARTAGTSGTDGISFFTVRGDADGLTRTALSTMDMTRKQAKLEFKNVTAEPLGAPGSGVARVLEDARPGCGRAVERDDGRRAEGARHVGRVREGACAVRPSDRFVPGDQAQVRRHAARSRVGQVGRVLRVVGRRRGQRRAAGGRRAVEGVLLGGVLPRHRREHPDPRWHRLHVGAPRAPVLQAREVVGDLPRRPHVPPRAAGPAHRYLSSATPDDCSGTGVAEPDWISRSRRSTRIGGSGGSARSRHVKYDVARVVRSFDADLVVVPEAWRDDDGRGVLDRWRTDGYQVETIALMRLELRHDRNLDVVPHEGVWELAVCSRFPVLDRREIPIGTLKSDPPGPRNALGTDGRHRRHADAR